MSSYVRDAQGNTLAVYEKSAVENGSNFDVTLQLKEQPIYGSDRLGQRTASKVLAASLNVSGSSGNIPFAPLGSGIQKKSEYQNWITSSNKNALIDATNQLCQQKVIHLEYNSTEYATPTTPDIPATTNFLGIAKNGVAIAENTDGELQFYVVLAEKYLGNKDACLIYDATGKLMKNTELISNIDINSKPIVINLAINKYAVVTLNTNKQPMYHIIDMDEQGYGTLINAGEVDATQVNVAMTSTTTAQYGLHFTAYEDHVNNKKIIYSTRYTPNVALPDQGTTEIVAFEFINNTTQLQQHVLYQINGCGNTEQGELQIAPEGDKLLWYQHDKYVTGFSHRVFDVYSIALHPDKISTTGVVDILDHTLANNYGGNYGEGRAEYDADNQTMYLSQRGIYLDGASGNESERNLWKYSPLNTTTLNPLNPTSVYLFSEIRRGVNGKLYMPNMDAAADAIHSYNPTGTVPTSGAYNAYHFASALPTQVYKLFGEEVVAAAGREIGKKQYFLNDHLGSVRVVISDVKLHNDVDEDDAISEDDYFSPSILSFSDTYPFGMNLRNFNPNETEYGFNGMRKESSLGNGSNSHLDFGDRIYDSRVPHFLSIDRRTNEYPSMSPYVYAANLPTRLIDIDGQGPGEAFLTWIGRIFGIERKTKEGLTTDKLRELAKQAGVSGNGVDFNRKVGKAFESLAKAEFLLIGPPKQFSTPERGVANGVGFKTIPDGTRDVTVVELSDKKFGTRTTHVYRNSSIFEVKAYKGRLRLSTSRGQIKAIIDIARSTDAGKVGRGVVTFITTVDTDISDKVIEYATKHKIQIFQVIAGVTNEGKIIFSNPFPQNNIPSHIPVSISFKQMHAEYDALLFLSPLSLIPEIPGDDDPEEVETNEVKPSVIDDDNDAEVNPSPSQPK